MSLTLQIHIISAFPCSSTITTITGSQVTKQQVTQVASCGILLGKWRSDHDLSRKNTSVLRPFSNKIGMLRHKRFHFQSFLAILIRRVCFDANNCDHSVMYAPIYKSFTKPMLQRPWAYSCASPHSRLPCKASISQAFSLIWLLGPVSPLSSLLLLSFVWRQSTTRSNCLWLKVQRQMNVELQSLKNMFLKRCRQNLYLLIVPTQGMQLE